ncbi:MAG: RNA-binding S4 domain-containing protein [Desulfobacteraceae bacterium]|nr:RNA-binding S4 domain-containing protein [Desulfobacteraceae bacterium]
MDEIFTISGEYIELIKLLKATGLCGTGGHAKMVVEDRLVKVDEEIETRKRRKVKGGMIVQYDNHSIKVVYNE